MPSMRMPRPKSLSGLMLVGFTIVAAPLLFAIVNAAVQMNRLSIRSQQLVIHGMQGTRNNQRMFEEIGALERTARLYQIIGNADLRDTYARNNARLVATINELLTLPLEAASNVSDRISLQIDHETAGLEAATQKAQQNLLWQTLLLAPMTMLVVGVFTYLFGRPLRAIDRAINE